MKKLIILNILLVLNINLLGQSNICDSSIVLSIENSNLKYNELDKKFIVLSIHNVSADTLFVPKWFCPGLDKDLGAEILFIIEKKLNNKEKYTPILYNNEADLDCWTDYRELEPLPPNKKKIFKEQFDLLYTVKTIGIYRIKAILIIQNICGNKEIRTDWKEFIIM